MSPVTGRVRVAGVLVSLPARVFGIATAGLSMWLNLRQPSVNLAGVSQLIRLNPPSGGIVYRFFPASPNEALDATQYPPKSKR